MQVSAAYGESLEWKGFGRDTAARTLAADIEMQLNALRNAAYAKGVTATQRDSSRRLQKFRSDVYDTP